MRYLTKASLPALLLLCWHLHAPAVGLLPTPSITSATVNAQATYDGNATGRYSYSYVVTSAPGNVGDIWDFKIDVSADQSTNSMYWNSYGFFIPMGSTLVDFNTVLSRLTAINAQVSTPSSLQRATVVPFGQLAPPGWNGGLGLDGFASFASGDDAPNIAPGSSQGGFQLFSYGVPAIRNVRLVPLWMLVVPDHETVSDADRQAAGEVAQQIVFETVTLGPSGVGYGSFAHWNLLRDDLAKAIQLGWISDPALAATLTSQLASARAAFDASDLFTAKARLQVVLDTIDGSTPAQRTVEGFGLVALNVQSLIDYTADNPFQPKVTLSPHAASASVGTQQLLTVTVIDLANGNRPAPDLPVEFRVDAGPNAGSLGETRTDSQGMASVTYVGYEPGTDSVTASLLLGEVTVDDSATIVWDGGADLVVPTFSPPLLKTAGGRIFYVHEETQNAGNMAAAASVTRYFISSDATFPPDLTRPISERAVPALQPGESSTISRLTLTIPGDLPEGTYFLAACADANGVVAERDESNNCSYSKVVGRNTFIVPIETPNQPPVCTQAAPSIALLWPPNHKLVDVSVRGVTDPDGDPVTISITGITQDEPVNGLGDGDTSPDGFGIGTSIAQLRAERSGTGNGRVYAVSFAATDGKGGSCTGKFGVGVPHDQGHGSTPIDDGQNYDSTRP